MASRRCGGMQHTTNPTRQCCRSWGVTHPLYTPYALGVTLSSCMRTQIHARQCEKSNPEPRVTVRACQGVATNLVQLVALLRLSMASPPAAGSKRSADTLDDPVGSTAPPADWAGLWPQISEWADGKRRAGMRPQDVLTRLGLQLSRGEGQPEEAMWCTAALMLHEYRQRTLPRRRLTDTSVMVDVVRLLRNCRRIVVLSGAGVSASVGIHDFRSPRGACAAVTESFGLPGTDALFDMFAYVQNPQPFSELTRLLFPGSFAPTPTHRFIRALEQHGKLLHNYTQNIDALEQQAGIRRLVQCHGSLATASCIVCKYQVGAEEIRDAVRRGEVPRCSQCLHELNFVKPDVFLFGESAGPDLENAVREDLQTADLLLVVGSSTKPQPAGAIINGMPSCVPQVLIAHEPVEDAHEFDVQLYGDPDAICRYLCKQLGWLLPSPTAPPPPLAKVPAVTECRSCSAASAAGATVQAAVGKADIGGAAKGKVALAASTAAQAVVGDAVSTGQASTTAANGVCNRTNGGTCSNGEGGTSSNGEADLMPTFEEPNCYYFAMAGGKASPHSPDGKGIEGGIRDGVLGGIRICPLDQTPLGQGNPRQSKRPSSSHT